MCNVLRDKRFVQNLWPLFCKHFKAPKSSKDIFKVTMGRTEVENAISIKRPFENQVARFRQKLV